MQNEKVILGAGVVTSNNSEKTQLNNNIIVVGPSGCGKTMSYAESRLLETTQSSMIINVSKRRLVEKYKKMFKDRGYEVMDLNFAAPGSSEAAYDPLCYVRNDNDVVYLAESIVYANPNRRENSKDPYWEQSAVSLLTALIAYVLECSTSEASKNFCQVLEVLRLLKIGAGSNELIVTTLDGVFEKVEKQSPDGLAISAWNTFRSCPSRTAGCILSTLNTTLDTIFTGELRSMIRNGKKIRFNELAEKKTALFVTTSAVNPNLHCFVNMFFGQAIKELFEYAEKQPDGALPVPVHLLCDDFACGSKILNFPEYISIFREKEISVSLLIQSESQLASMYGDNDATTIINNCDRYVYMGGMDLKTCRNVSERVNLPLEEVLYLPVSEEYVFQRGQRPVRTRRYNIREDRLYQRVTKEYEKRMEMERSGGNRVVGEFDYCKENCDW